jgi:hypothetical protein
VGMFIHSLIRINVVETFTLLLSERNNHHNISICSGATITIITFGQITGLQYHVNYLSFDLLHIYSNML